MWQYLPSEEQSKVSLDNGVNVDVFKMSQLIVKKNELIKERQKTMEYKVAPKPKTPTLPAKKK